MRRYAQVSGTVFTLVSVLQLLRVFRGWPAQVGDVAIPMWASGFAFVVAGAMALWAFRTAKGIT